VVDLGRAGAPGRLRPPLYGRVAGASMVALLTGGFSPLTSLGFSDGYGNQGALFDVLRFRRRDARWACSEARPMAEVGHRQISLHIPTNGCAHDACFTDNNRYASNSLQEGRLGQRAEGTRALNARRSSAHLGTGPATSSSPSSPPTWV